MKFLLKKKPGLLFAGTLGFFLGRVLVFQFVSPLAAAFAAGYLGQGFYIPAFLTLAGVLTSISQMYAIKPIAAFAVLAAVNCLPNSRLRSPVHKAAAAAAATLASGLLLSMVRGMSLYFATTAVMESLFVFGAAVVLQKSTQVLSLPRQPHVLGLEEQVSFMILSAAVIIGAMDIRLGILPLGWVFLVTELMFIVQRLGGSAGGAASLILGTAVAISGKGSNSLPVVLGLASVAAGAFRNKSKWSTAAAFAATLTLASMYLDVLPATGVFSALAAGSAFFILLPENLYFTANSLAAKDIYNADEYLKRVKTILSQRLYGFSNSFEKLSRTFAALAKPKTSLSKPDITRLIDHIAEKACHNCGMSVFCWRENFYETYGMVFAMLDQCERKNRIEIPREFNCVNVQRFAETANRFIEIHRLDMVWQNRAAENRELISEQLGSVSKLIRSLAEELELSMDFKLDLEDGIRTAFAETGIEVEQVIVLESKDGKYEVSISPKACPGRTSCIKELPRIISRVLGRKMRTEDFQCAYTKGCRLRLIEEQKFRVSSGVACRSKSGSPVSGDNYSFMELRNGQCLMALSDGMGSGAKAREESAAAVELLEDFIESGFEKDMAVRMINSVLVLKNDEDSFSTLDICSIDLHTGQAEFIKIGAAATYLLREGKVQTLKSSSLPIGMLNTVDLEVSSKLLKENDIIVMVTDGLTEADDKAMDKAAWISASLSGFNGRNPQDLADFLIAGAEKLSSGLFKDDMTVLAARIWQRGV